MGCGSSRRDHRPSARELAAEVSLSVARMAGAVAVILFGLFVAQWTQFVLTAGTSNLGVDYTLYRDATNRWLAGDGFYLARQLAGPYQVVHGDVLYPPTFLILLVPFTVLPALAWWAIPIGIVVAVILWHRPHPVAWALLALCLWYPITGVKVIHGNPGLWITAALALGTVFGWPSVLVLLKPTLAPFALVGVRSRGWWIALVALVASSLLFLPMWGDYVRVLVDSRGTDGALYSLNEAPMVAIPLIAWLGRRRTIRAAQPAPADPTVPA